MSQADVERECAERGISLDQPNLSRIERGEVKWPSLRILPVLAEVLGLEVDQMLKHEDAA